MIVLVPLGVFVLALLLQALFAGYETGFISTNPIRIHYLAEEEGSRRAVHLLRHMRKPDLMITALLVGTNVAVVVSTIVVSLEIGRLFPRDRMGILADLVSTVLVAPVMLVLAEIIPKSAFRAHPNRLTVALFPVIHFFFVLMTPVVVPLWWLTRLLLRATGAGANAPSPFLASLEDVRTLVDEGVSHGTIEREEQEMIHSVIDLQTTQANEIMVPRIHVAALPDTATRRELLDVLERTGWTRIPIYHETVDTIMGVVNAYDLLQDTAPENEDVTRFVKEVMHVPDTMKVGDLFHALKNAKQHTAIVTDEYGGTDGLVTVEDIIEEIFGEIQDEYDSEERRIHKVGPAAYVIDAVVPLDEIAETLGVTITDEEVETVGGWLVHAAGRIPGQGQVVTHGRFRFTVLDGSPAHVAKVRLEVLPEPGNPPAKESE